MLGSRFCECSCTLRTAPGAVTAAADVLGVSRPTLSTLLNENSDLSPDMALRIEKAFGIKMDTLLRMQNAYDIFQTRKREGQIRVKRYVQKPRRVLATAN